MRHAAAIAVVVLVAASASLGLSSRSFAQHTHRAAGQGGNAGNAGNAGATPPAVEPRPTRAPAGDARAAVAFPAELREHTLANMRDHLLALQEIQAALAAGGYDQAAEVSERRLGLSSLALHGAHEVAAFMPAGMQAAGTAMHRSASRFSVAARDAGVTHDLRLPLSALAELTATCVGCHASYRLGP